MVSMASRLPLNARISAYFDNIILKFSTHVYFMVISPSTWSNIKILKIDLYGVITNELYS